MKYLPELVQRGGSTSQSPHFPFFIAQISQEVLGMHVQRRARAVQASHRLALEHSNELCCIGSLQESHVCFLTQLRQAAMI